MKQYRHYLGCIEVTVPNLLWTSTSDLPARVQLRRHTVLSRVVLSSYYIVCTTPRRDLTTERANLRFCKSASEALGSALRGMAGSNFQLADQVVLQTSAQARCQSIAQSLVEYRTDREKRQHDE
jgi:hypothetical protein